MLVAQLALPTMQIYLSDQKRKAIGTMGEITVARMLELSGYEVSFTHVRERRGDLRVYDIQSGEIVRVEVKTARRSKDGKYRFTLFKKGCTDYRDADVVVLLPVLKSGRTVPFVIPVDDLGNRSQVCITSHPEEYSGMWVKYRQKGELAL